MTALREAFRTLYPESWIRIVLPSPDRLLNRTEGHTAFGSFGLLIVSYSILSQRDRHSHPMVTYLRYRHPVPNRVRHDLRSHDLGFVHGSVIQHFEIDLTPTKNSLFWIACQLAFELTLRVQRTYLAYSKLQAVDFVSRPSPI